MAVHYDIWLVLLSLVASCIAMFATFGFIERLYLSTARGRQILLPIYTLAIGTGLWGIHLINWLAFNSDVSFNLSSTFIFTSWLAALFVGFIACYVTSKKTISISLLLSSGLMAGLSSYAMYYLCTISLSATSISVVPISVFVALLLSVCVSILSIITLSWMKVYAGDHKNLIKIVFSLVAGIAIIGLHLAFTASIIAQVNTIMPSATELANKKMLAALISLAIVCLFLLVFVVALYLDKQGKKVFKFNATIQQSNAVTVEVKDALTNLPNRAAFRQLLDSTTSRNKTGGKTIALAYIDLDYFKPINDKFGHHVGDNVLTVVADRLQAAVRGCDVVARLGGDEFAALIDDIESEQDIVPIVERILQSIHVPIFVFGQKIEISCSIGVALYPQDGDVAKLIVCADAAMYKAKENGKNQFKFYDSEIASASNKTIELQRDLRAAIKKQQFMLVFQPKLDCQSQQFVGAEALIRWNHPTKGVVLPVDFITAAEQLGLIDHINDWVIENACAAIQQARHQGLDLHLSINLSRQQFRNSTLVEKTQDWLAKFEVPAQNITFEIKETLAVKNELQFKALLNQIKNAHIKIALDDFGLHPFTLNHLKDLHVNEVKLDKSFIAKIGKSNTTEALLDGMIHLAHKLNFNVVAEGIETEAQREAVLKLGCNHMQGYLFSKPLSEAELHAFCKNQQQNFKTPLHLVTSENQSAKL